MPIYDYDCNICGVFTALRKMSESDANQACPNCGEMSARVIMAPTLAILGATQRNAYERNEKSAHEPKMVKRSSCGCTGAHTCSNSTSKSSSKSDKATSSNNGLQMQTKKTARPWMLGH